MKVVAIMVVRDEDDVLGANIRYHRALGVDEVLVVDNGSSDRTVDVLRRLAARDPAVRWTTDDGPFRQAEIVTGMAREAHARGATWVLPTDADELWWSARPLREVLAAGAAAWFVPLVTYAQDRRVRERSPDGLLSMCWRPGRVVDEAEARPLVTGRRLSFLEMRYPRKYASMGSPEVAFHAGAHHVEGQPGERRATDDLVILHAPVRARVQLVARRDNGRRVAEAAATPDEGWHLRRLGDLTGEEALDAEWAACSVAGGALDVFGEAHPAVHDTRLRDAVAPFLGEPGWRGARLRRRARRVGPRPVPVARRPEPAADG